VLNFASTYGYVFLFAVSVAENIFLLGFVVPGDVAVVLGGALAARGRLEPFLVAVVVITGVVVGSNTSFWIGRRGGTPLIERWGARFSVDRSRILAVELYFRQHGAKTVFLASFVAGLKNLAPAVAGASRMGLGRFVAYNAAGSTVRGVALVAIGYVFGANLPRAIELAGSANEWVLGIILGAVLLLLVLRIKKRRRASRDSGANSEDRVDRGAAP
jgi:membrane protein DedA with SNARE-associated domain